MMNSEAKMLFDNFVFKTKKAAHSLNGLFCIKPIDISQIALKMLDKPLLNTSFAIYATSSLVIPCMPLS